MGVTTTTPGAGTDDIQLLEAADGTRVAYRHWVPDGEVRAALQIVHGLSEHGARYARLAAALTARGIAVAAADQRGHGRTADATGKGRFGDGAGSDAVLDDVRALGEQLAAAHPGVPLFLLGHSLGSAVALGSAERDGSGLAGLALSGVIGVAPAMGEAATQLQAAVDAGMGDQPMDALSAFNAPFEPARTPYDWLSRDPASRWTPIWPTRSAATPSRPLTATAPACSSWSPGSPPPTRSRASRTACRCCCSPAAATPSAARTPPR